MIEPVIKRGGKEASAASMESCVSPVVESGAGGGDQPAPASDVVDVMFDRLE